MLPKSTKNDTCNICDKLETAIDNEKNIDNQEELKNKNNTHQDVKDAQNPRTQNFERTKENDKLECSTFDLEKTLPLPRIPKNIVLYKHQLWVYTAGVHSGKNGGKNAMVKYTKYCFVWIESIAGGSQEVTSCLLKHIVSLTGISKSSNIQPFRLMYVVGKIEKKITLLLK